MKRSIALILAASVAVSMFAGCSKKDGDVQSVDTSAAAETSGTAGGTAENTETTEDSQVSEEGASIQLAYDRLIGHAGAKTFEELYGNQLPNYINHQYFFDGEAVPLSESDLYFVNAFIDFANYAAMGYYPATPSGFLDLAAEYPADGYETYGDYFVFYAEFSLESTWILYNRAVSEGLTLSNSNRQKIEDQLEDAKNGAANYGMTIDEYLQLYYGPNVNEESLREFLERYCLADQYAADYRANYVAADSDGIPYIRYALFYAPESASQDEKDAALASAQTMKDSCTTIDDITDLAAFAQSLGTVMDQGDIKVPKGQMVPKFEEWAYEPHQVGDMDIIYAPEYGYFLVGFLGFESPSRDELNQISMAELSKSVYDEMDSGKHDFHTDDAYLPAPAAQ